MTYTEMMDISDKSEIIDKNFSEIHNEQGLDKAILYLKSTGATYLDMDNYFTKHIIDKLTLGNISTAEMQELLNNLKENTTKGFIVSTNIAKNNHLNLREFIIETDEGIIRAIKLSEYFPNIKEIIPEIETESRYGKCFSYAALISKWLPIKNKIVSGFIWGYTDKAKYYHSWVEITINNEDYVIDATSNSLIRKQDFMRMHHAEIVTTIESETYKSDLAEYPEIGRIPLQAYYIHRNQIVQHLKKEHLKR